jgi:hypothetical protein
VKAIEYLVEYTVSSAELQEIPTDQKAVLAVVFFAVTEINTLRKLYLASDHNAQGIDVIDQMIAHQRNMILRLWSAKLFEFVKFINVVESDSKVRDPGVIGVAAIAKAGFDALCVGSGYQAAKNIRNEATNHYSFESAKKNLKHLDPNAPMKMFVHDMTGNAYYPWGDSVMFFGRFSRQGSALPSDAERASIIEDWMNWNLKATEWIDSVATQAFQEFAVNRFPKKMARRRDHWIDPILVSDTSERRTPIIMRKADQ